MASSTFSVVFARNSATHRIFVQVRFYILAFRYPLIVSAAVPNDWIESMQVHSSEGYEYKDPELWFLDLHWLRKGTKYGGEDWSLLDYLKMENGWDPERALDDFILIITLFGNDFLPALPLPDWHIRYYDDPSKDAISKAVKIWKTVVQQQRSYIVKEGTIKLKVLAAYLEALSKLEPWDNDKIGERIAR